MVQDNLQGSGYNTGFRIIYRVQDTLQGSGYYTGFRRLYRVQETIQGLGLFHFNISGTSCFCS